MREKTKTLVTYLWVIAAIVVTAGVSLLGESLWGTNKTSVKTTTTQHYSCTDTTTNNDTEVSIKCIIDNSQPASSNYMLGNMDNIQLIWEVKDNAPSFFEPLNSNPPSDYAVTYMFSLFDSYNHSSGFESRPAPGQITSGFTLTPANKIYITSTGYPNSGYGLDVSNSKMLIQDITFNAGQGMMWGCNGFFIRAMTSSPKSDYTRVLMQCAKTTYNGQTKQS